MLLSRTSLQQWCQVILQKQASKFEKQAKRGNLTEKQVQNVLAGKFNKTKNQEENQIKNHGGKSEKTSPKWANFHKSTSNMPLAVNWNSKSALKFEKKPIFKTEICKNKPKKTSKFQLKQAQKQAARKSSKKPQFHKKQAQIRGKPESWQHCFATTWRPHDRFLRNGEVGHAYNVQCSSQSCEKNFFRVWNSGSQTFLHVDP